MERQAHLGRCVFGFSALSLGLLGIYHQDFATVWQPVPPGFPGYRLAAIGAALLFLLSGAALLWKKSALYGGAGAAILYAIFTALWVPHVAQAPGVFANWGAAAEELALLAASIAVFARYASLRDQARARLLRTSTTVFGLCAIAFGCNHFFNMGFTAAMVPGWLPPNQWFWALFTGLAHALAGLAILSGCIAKPASRLLTLMYVLFGLLIWVPQMFTNASAPITWTGNAVNLALVGAAWIISETVAILAASKRDTAALNQHDRGAAPTLG